MPRKKHCRGLAIRRYFLINDSGDEIADDKQDVRKVMASEALESLDAVKCFAEIQVDERNAKWINRKSENIQVTKH